MPFDTHTDLLFWKKLKNFIEGISGGLFAILFAAILFSAGFYFGHSRAPSLKSLVVEASGGRAEFVRDLPKTLPGGWRAVLVAGTGTGKRSVAWASPDHRILMIGAAFDRAGTNLTRVLSRKEGLLAAKSAVPGPSAVPAATQPDPTAPITPVLSKSAFMGAVKRFTHGVTQYESGARHTLYVFFDPDCSFCHHLFERLRRVRPQLERAHIAVRWIPVAILRPHGALRAEAILAGGLKALVFNEDHFNVGSEKGGIAGTRSVAATTDLIDNMRVFASAAHQLGTPTLAWRDARGKVHRAIGMPTRTELQSLIASFSPTQSTTKR